MPSHLSKQDAAAGPVRRDPYEVLAVSRNSTDQEIKSAYRKMALKLSKGKQRCTGRCTCQVDFAAAEHPSVPPTVNDATIYEHARRVSIGILGEGKHELSPIVMGSEDFAFYLDKVAGSFLFLGMRNEKAGSVYQPHI